MYPVKKSRVSVSYAISQPKKENRNAVEGFKETLKRAEEGKILLDESFKELLKNKIKELE